MSSGFVPVVLRRFSFALYPPAEGNMELRLLWCGGAAEILAGRWGIHLKTVPGASERWRVISGFV